MYLIPIEIERLQNLSCVEQILNGMAKWKKSNYELMFLEEWDFNYLDNEVALPERFQLWSERKYELLEKYHGISIVYKEIESKEKVFNLIKKSIYNNEPIGIIVDTFWVPWMFGRYQKESLLHILLVVGFDEENEELICMDTQFAINGQRINKADFDKACVEYTIFSFKETSRQLKLDSLLSDILNNVCENEQKNKIFSNIRRFSKDLMESSYLDEFRQSEMSPTVDPLLNNLLTLANQRVNFARSLNFIQDEFGVIMFKDIIDNLGLCSEKWRTIFGILMKSYYGGNMEVIKNKVVDRINSISDLEEETFNDIKCTLSSLEYNKIVIKKEEVYKHYTGNVISKFIDISSYFNNKGICLEGHIIDGVELSNPERFILINNLAENNILSVENMKFFFGNVMDQLDNISCKGQEILINNEECDCISFLACAEFANYREDLQVVYEDNEIENIKFMSTSWINKNSHYDEIVAFHGTGAVKSGSVINKYPFPVSLFAKCYRLNRKSRVKKIVLPNISNVHIFAISLDKMA